MVAVAKIVITSYAVGLDNERVAIPTRLPLAKIPAPIEAFDLKRRLPLHARDLNRATRPVVRHARSHKNVLPVAIRRICATLPLLPGRCGGLRVRLSGDREQREGHAWQGGVVHERCPVAGRASTSFFKSKIPTQ